VDLVVEGTPVKTTLQGIHHERSNWIKAGIAALKSGEDLDFEIVHKAIDELSSWLTETEINTNPLDSRTTPFELLKFLMAIPICYSSVPDSMPSSLQGTGLTGLYHLVSVRKGRALSSKSAGEVLETLEKIAPYLGHREMTDHVLYPVFSTSVCLGKPVVLQENDCK
jgi:hypothetical protein